MSRSGAFGSSAPIRRQAEVEPRQSGRKVERTSAGLRDSLFDAIERVRDGDLDSEQAKAIGVLANQICNTVSLEIEVAKLRTQYPADAKLIVPAPLPLGPTQDKDK